MWECEMGMLFGRKVWVGAFFENLFRSRCGCVCSEAGGRLRRVLGCMGGEMGLC